MTDLEAMARVRVSSGCPVERLVCHPRLPLVAGLDGERPAVHVWSCEAGQLRELGSVGAELDGYADALGWERIERTPALAWHPDEPRLVVAGGECGVVQWTPAGLSAVDGVPSTADYRSLAFSPDGRTLWASPSSGDGWDSSDVIDLASGAVSSGRPWDTGVAQHPGGGLVVTLTSDQAATHGLFAQVDSGAPTGAMRLLRRALILDVDDYETPLFSADGRHFAIRGNAYENTLEVFEFPSLQRVLAMTLGKPSPGYPCPQEWLDQMYAWSRHNLAFGARPGVLWVGTPTGALVEVDIETPRAVEHDVLAGSSVSALAATATGELVLASGGELMLVSVRSDPGATHSTDDSDASTAAASAVSEFLDATSEVPDGGDLEEHLVLTDGERTWNSDDLATVDTATAEEPTWLQLRAAITKACDVQT
ncbi:hypothetical protein [Streptomyces rhizosphaerihabitans]|uniref:hypothetical protein n=1 Tax=Streptomyces rhizosphaerihabitans TaxID=1266770 RepID=UPI0021C1E1B3|nr:hypothetical protein [Streptomyces rhizosphaerihabitans]MCT9011296.1 hypothetical protein [Streptomyces rhizosphaerihabitans]